MNNQAPPSSYSPSPIRPTRRIPSLDGLRAISISLVVYGHWLGDHPDVTGWRATVLQSLGNPGLGVTTFFIISGFLITHLLLVEKERSGRVSLSRFYVRRVFRIVPAFWVYLATLGVLALCGAITLTLRQLAYSAFFFQEYNFDKWNWYLGHSWTLAVEEQFYLFWPIAVTLLNRRRLLALATATILICPFARYGFKEMHHGIVHRILFVATESHWDMFMCGCVAALVVNMAAIQKAMHQAWKFEGHLVAAVVAIIASSYPEVFVAISGRRLPSEINDLLQGLGISIFLLWCVQNHNSLFGRFLNTKIVSFIGVLSYSIYLWQQLFVRNPPFGQGLLDHYGLKFLLILAAAFLSYRLVELPFLRIRTRVFARIDANQKNRQNPGAPFALEMQLPITSGAGAQG